MKQPTLENSISTLILLKLIEEDIVNATTKKRRESILLAVRDQITGIGQEMFENEIEETKVFPAMMDTVVEQMRNNPNI